jgi:hexosaminidase
MNFLKARLILLFVLCSLCFPSTAQAAGLSPAFTNLIPMPLTVQPATGTYRITANTVIYASPDLSQIGQYLADRLNPATGYAIKVLSGTPGTGSIALSLNGDSSLGDEGYLLTITPDGITLSAAAPAGIFWGVQTIRQLLPPAIELATVGAGPWTLPAGTIRDVPRFGWRGFMLDVARHFFGLDEVKRVIDLMAYYKLNHLHLHLTDDQGWRIEIKAWPNLTTLGGSTQIGGTSGGFYTQADYIQLVQYAQSRFITIVPEIEMPGHTNAALASYPELTCTGTAPALNTTSISGASSLCITKDTTYKFVDDVIKEIAALTPGPYIHIGGDEASSTTRDDFVTFMNKAQPIVNAYQKQVIGWQEMAHGALVPHTVIQHWNWNERAVTVQGVQHGAVVIMSPVPLGERYPGYIQVRLSYQWDPVLQIKEFSPADVLGVEAPLWTEMVATRDDLDQMTFPWLLSYAEIGWSPRQGRDWSTYRDRLATHGARLAALGVDFYHSPEIDWPK